MRNFRLFRLLMQGNKILKIFSLDFIPMLASGEISRLLSGENDQS